MATTQASSDLLGGLSSTFLKWITDDLMPVLYASVVITLMVIGIILHSLILHVSEMEINIVCALFMNISSVDSR